MLTVYYGGLSSGVAGGVSFSCFLYLPLMENIPEFGPCIKRVPVCILKMTFGCFIKLLNLP